MINIGNISIGKGKELVLILGPCVMESEQLLLDSAKFLKENLALPFVFKSSFDKANRSSIHSFRGPGLSTGLKWLANVKETYQVPIITDIHTPEQAAPVGEVSDAIQIPAFLCRQTDLLVAAAKTGKPVHVKKGQFMAPTDMKQVVEKLKEAGCKEILLTDRGVCFGYNNLVSDMRSVILMQDYNVPVCFDATHSVQYPGSEGFCTGGDRRFVPYLAKSAVCCGVDAIYLETHPDPSQAKCDKSVQLPWEKAITLAKELKALHQVISNQAHLHEKV